MSKTPLVSISGVKVPVPQGITEARAQQIAKTLETRLAAIQEASDRIDTYGFALRLALELAHEKARIEDASRAEEIEMLRQLTKLNDAMETNLDNLREDS